MGFLKNIFNPKEAEEDRYKKLLSAMRNNYPPYPDNADAWKNVSPTDKIKACQNLGISVEELRLLKAGKSEDVLLSTGNKGNIRIDERGQKVYSTIYDEYNKLYQERNCDPILQTVIQQKDNSEVERQAQILEERIEKDTDNQRKIIIAIGGLVLLIGTIIIVRKL